MPGRQAGTESDFKLVEGSGIVFRDLGDPEADLRQAKTALAARSVVVVNDRKLSVRKSVVLARFAAANLLCVRNADLKRFTLDRLVRQLRTPCAVAISASFAPRAEAVATTRFAAEGG